MKMNRYSPGIPVATACFRRLAGVATAFALILVSAMPALGDSETKQLRAGAATSNITPFLDTVLVGGWGQPRATHVHDELYARCLVLDNGDKTLVFVVCDNLSIDRIVLDAAKEMAHQHTGIPKEQMLMSATHTHSGPSARGHRLVIEDGLDEYQRFLARRIADGVRRAVNNLEPAQIGWGVGREPDQVFNRRWIMTPASPHLANPFGGVDKVRMNPPARHDDLIEPAGPTDPDITFLSVRSITGRPIALLANYSLHYVGGTGANTVSADYFAYFADEIQRLLDAERQDPPFVGILSNGTSGDINNINFRGTRERLPPYAKIRQVANAVAAEVYRVLQTVEYHDWVPLDARQAETSLAVRIPSPDQIEWANKVLARPETVSPVHARETIYAERTLRLADWPSHIDVLLQAFRVGEVGIAAIPFEVFVEIGLEIKEKSPLQPSFTISLANGGYGYLPTPRQHELGGYETWLGTCSVEKEASVNIVHTLLEQFTQMQSDTP